MFSRIIQSQEIEGSTVWLTDNGTIGTSFLVDLADLEIFDNSEVEEAYADLLRSISTDISIRVQLIRDLGRDVFLVNSHRKKFLSSIGHVEHALVLHFERQARDPLSILYELFKSRKGIHTPVITLGKKLLSSFDLIGIKGLGIKVRGLSELEVKQLCFGDLSVQNAVRSRVGVDFGESITGVIRLVKPGTNPVSQSLMSSVLNGLGEGFEVRVQIKKKSAVFSEGFLRRTAKRAEAMEDRVGARRYLDSQQTLEKIAVGGEELCSYEMLILFKRENEEAIRRDGVLMLAQLRVIGEFYLETVGALPSLIASSLASPIHVGILETGEVLSAMLPVATFGRGYLEKTPKKGSLLIHRRDLSLDEVDVFNPQYDNHSMCVFGVSGRGKSVFTNLLTDALLEDPQNHIIKVDVGGSHSRQTLLAGGEEFNFSVEKPSNIDPFLYLREGRHIKESVQILAAFLEVLLLEDGELRLSKSMKQEVEALILGYAECYWQEASFEDFVLRAKDCPRGSLLKRWIKGGVFENAFKTTHSKIVRSENRLRYYNFSDIFQAQDPDFAQAGFCAVMALFNFEGLLSKNKRLVFICDETPFFIKRCFNFFHLSIANVRKLGHSFITVCQKSSDVVVGGDTSILDNSHIKVLFSIDGEERAYIVESPDISIFKGD